MPFASIGRRRWLQAALAWPALHCGGAARARADPAAVAPIRELCDGLLSIMRAGQATPFAQRFAMLAPAIDQAFDLPAILQVSVGPAWSSLPPDQQATLRLRSVATRSPTTSTTSITTPASGSTCQPDTKSLPNGEQVVQTQDHLLVGRDARAGLRHAPGGRRLEGGGRAGGRLDQPRRGAALGFPPAGGARRRAGVDREPEPEDHGPVGRRR